MTTECWTSQSNHRNTFFSIYHLCLFVYLSFTYYLFLSYKLTNVSLPCLAFFLLANAGKVPFFLYMAFQHTHKPQFSGKRFINSSIRGMFDDSLNKLQVGQIMNTLISRGVSDNTFMFFTADNGPSLHMGPREWQTTEM